MLHDSCIVVVFKVLLGGRQVQELADIYLVEVGNVIEGLDGVEIILIIQSPAIINVRDSVALFHDIWNDIVLDLIIPALAAALGAVL